LLPSFIQKFCRSFQPRHDSTKKFIRYCIYAFGLPVAMVALVATLNDLEVIPAKWGTGIGSLSCAISDPVVSDVTQADLVQSRWNQWIYQYGPIALLLAANTGFFATTAHNIYDVQNQVKRFTQGERSKHTKNECMQ
jgi:hypothetical protein